MNYLSTELGASPVLVEGTFAVSAETAFEAWTDPSEIHEWFGPTANCMVRAEIDLKVGGAWQFIFEETDEKTVMLEGEYLEIVQNEKLVFSWRHAVITGDNERVVTESSKVTLRFNEADGNTTITLNHENITSKDGLLGVGKGWQGTFKNFNNKFAANN